MSLKCGSGLLLFEYDMVFVFRQCKGTKAFWTLIGMLKRFIECKVLSANGLEQWVDPGKSV